MNSDENGPVTVPDPDGHDPSTSTGEPRGEEGGLRRLARDCALGVVAGLALCASLPPWGWWPLAFVGAGIWYHIVDTRPRQRFIVSWFIGLGWYMPSTLWIWALTPPGYLVGGLVGWCGLIGLVGVSAIRGPKRFAVLAAGVMVFEWLHTLAPFGGVPISMLSFSQARGPLLPVARLAGGIAVSGLIIAIGATLFMGIVDHRWREFTAVAVITAVLVAAGAASSTLIHPVTGPSGSGTDGALRIAAVQGGGPQGYTFDADEVPRVFRRHLDATKLIRDQVDLVVWPENTVYIIDGTFDDDPWRDELAEQAARLDAPILVGVVESHPTDESRFLNYQVVVEPDGSLGDRYDKQRRVPFGEYVPLRGLFEKFAGDELPGRDAFPGTGPAIMRTDDVELAVAISWEIFFPRIVREGVRHGGQMVLNPTNGSSYWLTILQSQQVATSTYRAVESGRWVIQVSPTGFSAVIDPTGRVVTSAGVGEQKTLIADVPAMEGTVPARAFGELPVLVVVGAILSWVTALRRLRSDAIEELNTPR